MNQAELYNRANLMQRYEAKRVIDEYANLLQWRLDGKDSLIDIGCGSGDVLMDFVYPLMPKNFGKIVGTDISENMIRYAIKQYAEVDRTDFRVLDIGTDDISNEFLNRFDHVTSFYCLHWVQNQRQAFKNIYSMIRHRGGDCLLVFLASNIIFDMYRILFSSKSKWAIYMKDLDKFISPLHDSDDPAAEVSQLLCDVGFDDYTVEVRDEVFAIEGVEILRDNMKAVNPFLAQMPESLHEEFMDDILNVVVDMGVREEMPTKNNYKFHSAYKLIVAYARK